MSSIISYTDWLTWIAAYEPTLASLDSTTLQLSEAYDESCGMTRGLKPYLHLTNYRLLLYRYALHTLIVQSGNSAIPQLANLYTRYEIKKYAGIIQNASDGPSSATKLIPNKLQEGDAQTMLLWSTPYGQGVETVFEQLRNTAITI